MSLFALTKEAKGVNIRGMKYSLENAVITNDFPIGSAMNSWERKQRCP